MKKIFISIIILTGFLNSIKSQDTDLRELFLAAESYYLFEEFNEALPLYLRIHRHFPDNDNINFKIGVCFLNNPYEKNKSIMYLEKAVENINPKHRENSYKETGAPLESIFYLANAYRVNNQLSKARNYYNIFLTRMDPDIYDGELVNEQLAACDAAESLMKKPIDYDMTSLSTKINTRFADMNPVVSGDESKIAFISKLQFYDAVFYAEKVNGEWSPPRNIVPELGVDGDVYPTALSYNGTELLVYRNDDYIGNIYYSRFVNEKWTPLQKLGDNINTKYWESHASFSKDGKVLYFSSNRKGGFGGLDIYKSNRQTNGNWGPAENLGPVINTKHNDDTPFITEDGEKIYFCSYGHYSMGGYDLFMSKKNTDGTWAQPVNLGFPLNSTDDDQFYLPLKNGAVGYYSRYTQEGFGRHDILRYEVYNPDNPRLFDISGLIDFSKGDSTANDIKISVVEKHSNDTITSVNPDEAGKFNFKVPAGNYFVIFDSDKFKKYIENLEVSSNSPHEGFALSSTIGLELQDIVIPSKDITDYLSLREDSIITASVGERVKIRYNAEPGSNVSINVLNDSLLVFSDSLEIDKKRQSFEFNPLLGNNEISIKLQDKEGNTTEQNMLVIVKESSKTAENIGMDKDSSSSTSIAQTQNNEADILKQRLIDNTQGDLNSFIQSIDTKAEGINTKEELLQYINEYLEEKGIAKEELNSVLVAIGELSPMKAILNDLQQLANPQLSNYLKNLNSKQFEEMDMNDFFNYLYSNAETENYSTEDVDQLVQKFEARKDLQNTLEELEQLADGDLSSYLGSLDLDKEGISSYDELIDHLVQKAAEGVFSDQELLDLLNKYSDSSSVKKDSKIQASINEDDRLGQITSTISEDSLKTMTDQQLYEHMFQNADSHNVETEELIRMLLEVDSPDLDLLIAGLKITGKDFNPDLLDNLPDSIKNSKQLFDYLFSIADNSEDLDRDSITNAYRKYLENKDLYDFLNTLKKYSNADLLAILENIDIDKEQIIGRTGLVEYLLNNSTESNFSKQDIYEAISAADNETYLRRIIDRMIDNANPALKRALMDLKQDQLGNSSLENIISFLLQHTDDYGYTKDDALILLSKYSKDVSLDESEASEAESESESKNSFRDGLTKTILILLLEGLIIFILILLARRKKDKKKDKE